MIAFLLALPRQLSNLEARFNGLASRLRTQEKAMATFKDSLDNLKTAQEDFTSKALDIISKQANGELVTDDERTEVQAMADALNAATAKLGTSAPTTPPIVDTTGTTTVGDGSQTIPASSTTTIDTPVTTPAPTDPDTGAPSVAA